MPREQVKYAPPAGSQWHGSSRFAGWPQSLRDVGFTAAICVVIAVIIWAVSDSGFLSALAFSMPIGLSTHLYTRTAMTWFPKVHVFLVWTITIPLAVLTGVAIGGLILGIPLGDLADEGLPIGSLVIALIATYIFYSYYTMNEMRGMLREQEVSQLRSEKRLVETQMRLLQSQIEPHFLFNTLSNVLSLVRTDPSRAEDMLQQLTRFLRSSLQRSREEHATLGDELDLLESYLSIIKIRMGERLDYSIRVNGDAADVSLSPLILQPLIENAVIHGLEPMEEGGRIDVEAEIEGDFLKVSVEDTGAGLADHSKEAGFGLANVRSRLDMLYDGNARMEFSDVEPHGLRIRLWLPRA